MAQLRKKLTTRIIPKPTETPKVTVKNLKEPPPKFLISTGNTLFNLALSDNPNGGYGIGKMVNLIGDSSSGKTILALTMLAECHNDIRFKDYIFIFDDAEVALEIDIVKMFGQTFANRVIFRKSKTIEDFYGAIYNLIQAGKPFIYILDSFDAVSSREEMKRAAEFGKQEAKRLEDGEPEEYEDEFDADGKEKPKKEKKEKGSYKLEKPKMAGEIFRVCCEGIAKLDSFLLILSQTRDNIGFGAMFTPKTRNGGKALKFYATHEIWLANGESHKKLGRPIGGDCMVKITKNKLTGKRREVYFPIYEEYGVDSIESCINFLVKEKHWTKVKGVVNAHDLSILLSNKKMSVNSLIHYIENNDLEKELIQITTSVWEEIEESLKMNRKPKYE